MAKPRGIYGRRDEPSGIAIIYARYSSHSQREVSIEQQVNKCMEYAARANLQVIESYCDKAITGKTDRRPNFQRMMKDAEKGKFRYVIAWKSNRMGRDMMQAMVNEARLSQLGVRCLYVEEDFDDTAAGRFALRNMMNVNQFYSENMAEDIMRGLMDNAVKCMVNNGGLPLGYKKGEDGRYAIDEKTAPIVREIFERVNEGEAFVEIANDFNTRGIKTSRGNLWNKGSFHRILVNERYIGVYKYADFRKEDGVPAIVRKELFYSVQEKLKTKKNPQGRHRENGDYLLTGKLYCGHCGSFMTGLSGTSKTGDLHYYYICQKKRTEKSCDKKTVKRDWIEQRIAEAVRDYIMQDDVIEWIAAGYSEFMRAQRADSALLAAEDELASVNKSLKNIMSAIEQGIITPTTRSRLMELEDEKRRLEITISVEKAAQAEVDPDMIIFWMEKFREGNVTSKEYQKKIIDMFVQTVYLYDNELKIVFNYCGKNNSITIPFGEIDALGHSEGMGKSSFTLPMSPPRIVQNYHPQSHSLFQSTDKKGTKNGVLFIFMLLSMPYDIGIISGSFAAWASQRFTLPVSQTAPRV